MRTRDPLPAIVVVAIAVLFAIVVVVAPSVPAVAMGTLPLGETLFRPALQGTYHARCLAGTLPIWSAVFLDQSNRSTTTFHLSGAWTATHPTSVEFGSSMNTTSIESYRDWWPFLHCPIFSGNGTPTQPPTLPTSGSVEDNVTTFPNATMFVLIVRAFDPSDIVQVTEPFTVTPI